ncbi:hypothetical protein M422DRAFT_52178 [Sphaerobolus stellatus SS14]|uniref:Uncharacterized protein n=1 Tax=Sphaerobolus stellatus (strain SS14) TaxID=990650 RepID=A0A0C9V9V3_SPHS4|nr:hypothetical protein M422DRAFT_52178 [Sphaerobolus stellatus SS14]
MSTTSDFSTINSWMQANTESFDPTSIAPPELTNPPEDDTGSPAPKANCTSTTTQELRVWRHASADTSSLLNGSSSCSGIMTDTNQSYILMWTTGLKITEEGESEDIQIDGDHFTKTLTIQVTVPPRPQLTFYQKCYNFRDKLDFFLDTWTEKWNVGPWGGYNPLASEESRAQILAEK